MSFRPMTGPRRVAALFENALRHEKSETFAFAGRENTKGKIFVYKQILQLLSQSSPLSSKRLMGILSFYHFRPLPIYP